MKKSLVILLAVCLISVLIFFNLKINRVGTGLLWGNSSYIVTHYHLVRDASAINVRLYNENRTPAQLTAWDQDNNLALLKIDKAIAGIAPHITIGDSSNTKIGEAIFTLGYPLINTIGDRPHRAEGFVESRVGLGQNPNMFQIVVELQSGNSGVPLFNRKAELIGLALTGAEVRRMGNADEVPDDVNFAVKSTHLRKLLENIPGDLAPEVDLSAAIPLDETALKLFVRGIEKNIVLVEATH